MLLYLTLFLLEFHGSLLPIVRAMVLSNNQRKRLQFLFSFSRGAMDCSEETKFLSSTAVFQILWILKKNCSRSFQSVERQHSVRGLTVYQDSLTRTFAQRITDLQDIIRRKKNRFRIKKPEFH